jgi:hypothetical protein
LLADAERRPARSSKGRGRATGRDQQDRSPRTPK